VDISTIVESTPVESTTRAFAALGDPTRLRILTTLASEPRCVCDLQEAIGVAPNLLSYHLKVLREAGLVTATRRGRWIDYRLRRRAVAALGDALVSVLDGPGS
jgi:ArsR family transcriptional regulator, arsenate/arsenite/antimonite-responsive transcriptional repressor